MPLGPSKAEGAVHGPSLDGLCLIEAIDLDLTILQSVGIVHLEEIAARSLIGDGLHYCIELVTCSRPRFGVLGNRVFLLPLTVLEVGYVTFEITDLLLRLRFEVIELLLSHRFLSGNP